MSIHLAGAFVTHHLASGRPQEGILPLNALFSRSETRIPGLTQAELSATCFASRYIVNGGREREDPAYLEESPMTRLSHQRVPTF